MAVGEDGAVETKTGQVEQALMGSNGQITLVVGDTTVDLADVVSVRNEKANGRFQ